MFSKWLVFIGSVLITTSTEDQLHRNGVINSNQEKDLGDGLKVFSIYKPDTCVHQAKQNDVIHYHYVGRLASDGSVFGKSFDYNSPYIVALGQGRIIPGMDRGLMGICLWERRRISFPPHLGYGSRGVGSTIPPNASLVFYVRLIKIERNGHVLGEDADITDLWQSGLMSYTDQKWQEAVDMVKEALQLFYQYDNQTLHCVKKCKAEGTISEKNTYTENDQLLQNFIKYTVQGRCIRECKVRNLPPNLRNPDAALIQEFRRRVPYSYLHYALYQVEEYEEAAKSCFTFLHYNPTDELALGNLPFYRDKLSLDADGFIYSEPELIAYQEPFIKAKRFYELEHWLESADLFEDSLVEFKKALNNCYLLCEDIIHLNMTQPSMNKVKKELLDEYGFQLDTMEYHELLMMSVEEVLKCRTGCYDRCSIIKGTPIDDYLEVHLDYLQFSYFKLGNLYKAAEAAATYLAMDPSNDVMAQNIRFFSSNLKLSSDEFIPRKDIVEVHQQHDLDQRLLYFAKHGKTKKKAGRKGDAGEHSSSHEEL